MSTGLKVTIVTVVAGVVTFLASPNGPLGTFWAPTPDLQAPTGFQVPLFMLLGAAESLVFGLGLSFLIFGYPWVQAVTPASKVRTIAAYLSIAWLLMNWWPHDSLHIHNGLALNGLLAIEYGFHFTLMIAGLIMAEFFLAALRHEVAVR